MLTGKRGKSKPGSGRDLEKMARSNDKHLSGMTNWQGFDLLYLPLCLGDLGEGKAVRGRMATGVSRFGLK